MANPSCGGKILIVVVRSRLWEHTELGHYQETPELGAPCGSGQMTLSPLLLIDPTFTHVRNITYGAGTKTLGNSLVVLMEALNEALLLQWFWARPGPVLVTNF